MPGNNLKLEPWGKDDSPKDESLPQVPGATNDKGPSAWQRSVSPASGGQAPLDFDEPISPRARSPNLHKRMILANRDKESLLEEIIDLKKALSDQAYHLRLHKVHASAVQIENSPTILIARVEILRRRLEKDIEDLEVSGSYEAPRTGGPTRLRCKLQGLKTRLGDLQSTCDLQHDELCQLRRDIRVTRIREVEVERDVYAGEIGRLQKIVKRLKALSARVTAENQELQRLKDKAARLEIANQRLESCISVVQKTLERAGKEVTNYRAKATESQAEAKKFTSKIKVLQDQAASLEAQLEKERIQKRKIAQKIKAVALEKREWDKDYHARQKKNQIATSLEAVRKKKKKKKAKAKSGKTGETSGVSGTDKGESGVDSSSSEAGDTPRGLPYQEFEARKLSFLSKVETASHSFVAQEKGVYGTVVERSLKNVPHGSHGYGSGGPYGGATSEFDSTFGAKGATSSPGGGRDHRDESDGGSGKRGYDAGGKGGQGGYGGSDADGKGGTRSYDSDGEGSDQRVGSKAKKSKGLKGPKTGKDAKGGKEEKEGKGGFGSSASSVSGYGSSSGGQHSAASDTFSTGSDSSLLLSPDDKRREQDVEGTFYDGMDTAAEQFMDSVEELVTGKGQVPKLNLDRMKAREAAAAKKREEDRIIREREERWRAQEQEAKRLASELALERRLTAQRVEEETLRRLRQISEQGGLALEIDHERLDRDEYESEIVTDQSGRLSLQISLKRSSEHPYPGSPRALAEAEAEAARQRAAREAEAQMEETRRRTLELQAREEAVRQAEQQVRQRQQEEQRQEMLRHQQEAAHEAEVRRKAEEEMKRKFSQEAAAKQAAEDAAKVSAWVKNLSPEQLEEFRRRVAAGEDPASVMRSMKAASKIKAWEATLSPEELQEFRRRIAAGEDPLEVMKSMQTAAKLRAWESTLSPEQLAEYRRRVAAGEDPEEVMNMMQWEASLTPEQLAELRRRVANGENPKDVMRSMQLAEFESSLSPEEMAEYQRRVAAGEDPYAVMEAMLAKKKRLNAFGFLDKDMQGFIKENIKGVLGHLENITEVIVQKQEELGVHQESASTAAGAAMDVLKASEKDGEKKKKKKNLHIQEPEESSSRHGTPRKERSGESSRGSGH